jgi:hypothetical protein
MGVSDGLLLCLLWAVGTVYAAGVAGFLMGWLTKDRVTGEA